MIFLPIHVTCKNNQRMHWAVKAKKTKAERDTTPVPTPPRPLARPANALTAATPTLVGRVRRRYGGLSVLNP